MKLLTRVLMCCLVLLMCGSAAAQRNRAVLSIPDVDKKDVICFALYTVSDDILRLTAQLYPLTNDDPKTESSS